MPHRETHPRPPSVFARPAATAARPTRRTGAAGLGVPTGPTVAWMVERFLACVDDGSARDRYGRPYTRDAVRGLHWHLRAHFAQARGGCRLRQLDRSDIETLLLELRAAGLSTERLRALAQSVRALYDHALERRLVDENPAERVAIPDEHDDEQPTLRPPATRRPRLHAHVRLLVRLAALAVLLAAIGVLGAAL